MENAFVKILSKTGLVGKISSGSRKDNPSMVDFGYNNNTIGNGNVADSGMIALSNDPLPCRKPKKEWKLKCK